MNHSHARAAQHHSRWLPPWLPHLLDPLWRRVPFPVTPRMTVEAAGPVTLIRMERSYFGRRLMPVYCFQVGDTLVDSGLSCLARPLQALVEKAAIRRALLTHHHEDHAGNAATLLQTGVQVFGTELTARIVARGFPIHFYQHILWGAMAPASLKPLQSLVIGPHEATVIPAPGHCDDQVVYHVPGQGWLFSGDAFIHEHVRAFRRDEDFAGTLATLERLLTLDFDVLFCAHRPRLTGGKEALRLKRQWLQDIEGQTRALHTAGASLSEINQRLAIGPRNGFNRLTLGDVSSENMIRSILFGPELRPAHRHDHLSPDCCD